MSAKPNRVGKKPPQKYSIFSLAHQAMQKHTGWQAAWRSPEPQAEYDVIIVGGGGHGLATAYYLAKETNVGRIAVLEKGWLAGGNTARNTTIIRSNYLCDESAKLYGHAHQLWEGLSQDINYNVMFSPRGVLMLSHNVHDQQVAARHFHALHLNGIESHLLGPEEIQEKVPLLNMHGRYPVLGGLYQPRAGNAHHNALAWGYARAADQMGVDIIENCGVTGFMIKNGVVKGVKTVKGVIRASKVGVVAAGHSSVLAEMAGFKMPLESMPLQAFVSEPVKPCFNTVVMSNSVHVYMSQSDKGELVIGAGSDNYVSYTQRGSFDLTDCTISPLIELYPFVSRLRMLRQWAGIVDITKDRSPIITKTPIENLYFNCGWGTGGFKATPGSGHVFAHSIAAGEMHKIAVPFGMDRFTTGALINEAAAVMH
ncbi:MAG: sarcosine oxidase subunit beta family protein [Alphaproteobacteria bacterium]|nr:sarcosine oxidase subunit beta family protein [Alphaproteobacteria bacterium]